MILYTKFLFSTEANPATPDLWFFHALTDYCWYQWQTPLVHNHLQAWMFVFQRYPIYYPEIEELPRYTMVQFSLS